MKIFSFTIIFGLLIPYDIFGQEPINYEFEDKTEQKIEQVEYKKNRFSILLDLPSLKFYSKNSGINSNIKGIGMGFDYNFSEIISFGLHLSYLYTNTTDLETDGKLTHRTLDFAPVFKINLGRNQMVVPFLEASYTLSIGKYTNTMEDIYNENYVRHVISGGVGLRLYASRWFKKTKYKNSFGIDFCISKALFLFDNSINVPLLERSGYRISFFYRF